MKITAQSSLLHLGCLRMFDMPFTKQTDGTFTAEKYFASKLEAKEYLKQRAKHYGVDELEESYEDIESYGYLRLDYVTAYIKNDMTTQQIKKQLESILNKINNNGIEAWNADLESSVEAVCLDDFKGDDSGEITVKYNGWLEDLDNLIKNL